MSDQEYHLHCHFCQGPIWVEKREDADIVQIDLVQPGEMPNSLALIPFFVPICPLCRDRRSEPQKTPAPPRLVVPGRPM